MCNAANLKRHEMDGSEQTSMKTIPLKIYEILRNKPQLNASKNGLNGCIEWLCHYSRVDHKAVCTPPRYVWLYTSRGSFAALTKLTATIYLFRRISAVASLHTPLFAMNATKQKGFGCTVCLVAFNGLRLASRNHDWAESCFTHL